MARYYLPISEQTQSDLKTIQSLLISRIDEAKAELSNRLYEDFEQETCAIVAGQFKSSSPGAVKALVTFLNAVVGPDPELFDPKGFFGKGWAVKEMVNMLKGLGDADAYKALNVGGNSVIRNLVRQAGMSPETICKDLKAAAESTGIDFSKKLPHFSRD